MASLAPSTSMTNSVTSMGNDWSESRILSSLDRLQNMHIQLRQVRGTIPRLVEPLLLQHGSPEDLYIKYSQNALDTGKEIRALADLVETNQYQEILQRAKDSRTAEPDGITPWMVTEHADWLEVRKLDDQSDIIAHREPQDTLKSAGQAGQDASVVLEQFKANHPGIDVKLQEGNHQIIEVTIPPPAPIHFQINLDSSTPIVTCKEKSKMHLGILRTIAARPTNTTLEYLLEMLASYHDMRSRPCVRCNRILDRNAQFPTVRAEQRTKSGDSTLPRQWKALHEGCAGTQEVP